MNNDQPITLVLLPGLDGTGKLFQPFISALPHDVRRQVVVYPPAKRWSVNEHAQFVANRLPQGRIVLLAESFSGLVALALLASSVTSVEAIVFCASFAEPPRPWLLGLARRVPCTGSFMRMSPAFLLRRFCIGARANAEQVSLLRAVLSEVSPEVLTHRLRVVATERSFVRARFKVPCYYLQGTSDRLVPSHMAHWFEHHFEFFRLEQVDGPHFLLLADPQECAERVVSILKETANKSDERTP